MSVRAVSDLLTTAARMAAPHYIKGLAGAFLTVGLITSAVRKVQHGWDTNLVDASKEGKKTLEALNAKLENWAKADAKALLAILQSKELCGETNPHPLHRQVGGLNGATHFQDAARDIKKLTDVATKISKVQDEWLKGQKDDALTWLKEKDQLGLAVRKRLTYEKEKKKLDGENQQLLSAMNIAKEAIEKDEITAQIIAFQINTVREAYTALHATVNNEKTEITVKSETKKLNAWFPEEDEYLKKIKDSNLPVTYTEKGKITDDLGNLKEAITGLKEAKTFLPKFDQNVEGFLAAQASARMKQWNEYKFGLHNPLVICSLLAIGILAANWGAPYYLGANHNIVILFKLPS